MRKKNVERRSSKTLEKHKKKFIKKFLKKCIHYILFLGVFFVAWYKTLTFYDVIKRSNGH